MFFPGETNKLKHHFGINRYVILHDDNGLTNELDDLIQFVYCQSYSYVFANPFSMGPPNSPAVVRYSEHYSKLFHELLKSSDKSLEDLRLSKDLPRPHIVISQ